MGRDLDLTNLHQIILVIIQLLEKYDDPTVRWYLVSMVGKIVTEVDF